MTHVCSALQTGVRSQPLTLIFTATVDGTGQHAIGVDVAQMGDFIETDAMQLDDEGEADPQRSDFTNLPGTHVHVRSLGGSKRQFVKTDGTVLAERRIRWRKSPLYPNPQVTVGGRVFEERLLGKRRNNHMRTPRELVELATGKQLFRIDGLNFNGSANAVIHFAPSRWYSFPVEGTKQPYRRAASPEKRLGYPVMTATDNAGQVALHFADPRQLEAKEIVIAPDQMITPELLVMMATASPFLAFYFVRPGE